MLLRGGLRSFGSSLRVSAQRSGVRRMCTAVAEAAAEEAPAASPFAASTPHNAQFYIAAGVTYLFALKWQAADRSLAKEIAAHKEAHPDPVVVVRARPPLRFLPPQPRPPHGCQAGRMNSSSSSSSRAAAADKQAAAAAAAEYDM